MKKIILSISLFSSILLSCGEGAAKERELELREREIALKEKELGINNSSNQTDYPREKTEVELKQELLEKECRNPKGYLSGSLSVNARFKNLISTKVNGLKLQCTIKNKATLATFKNIKAKATFKSKTGVVVFSKTFDIYDFVGPNSSLEYKTEFEITNQQYNDYSNYSWEIISAECN